MLASKEIISASVVDRDDAICPRLAHVNGSSVLEPEPFRGMLSL